MPLSLSLLADWVLKTKYLSLSPALSTWLITH